MNKCRICLAEKRKLKSIFDSNEGYYFASMMMSVANIKIVQNEGITEEICRRCCQKLVEAYNLKVLIERSDETLRNSAGFKRIHFTNLQDEIQMEIDTTKEIPQQCYDIADSFKNGKSSLVFKNITIQKIDADDIKIKKESEPLSVVDFLNRFKPEEDAIYHDDDDFDQCDDDYTPQSDDEGSDYNVPLSKCKLKDKKRNPKKQNHSTVAGNGEVKLVHIKPVILKDVKVMPSSRTRKKTKKKPRDKRYMCNFCGKITTSKTHVLLHTGVRSYKCDICSKAYLTAKQLEYHKKKHTLEKTFKCDKCVASFTSATLLKSHHNVHLNEYKFVCDTCSKSFKWKDGLKRHKLLHNAANKCINCDLCNMSFFTKSALKCHLRIHTGERPYKCEICNQPYSYKHDFNRHCLKKHGVFLKRRAVYVMNEEVLQKERAVMRDLMVKMQGVTREDEPLNPFEAEGPQGALAFELAIKALKSNNIPID